MPSFILGQPPSSGAQIIYSGNPYSGHNFPGTGKFPQTGVQLRLHPNASGNVYVGLSGNMTTNSGGFFLSGGGQNDGMIMGPGDSYFVPSLGCGQSGNLSLYFTFDVACSGQARMYYEIL